MVVNGEPTYSVSGDISQPGTYTITPSALSLYPPSNYTVGSYQTGILTVNVDPATMTAIRPALRCVEVLNNDADGFKYLARFDYINRNPVTIYIPVGPDNILNASGKYLPLDQPEYFLSAGGAFNVKFNGERLIWTVTSYEKTKRTSVATEASATSTRCKKGNGREAADMPTLPVQTRELQSHPNPAHDIVKIGLPATESLEHITLSDFRIIDQTGRQTVVPVRLIEAEHAAELDIRELTPGMYFVRIRHQEGYHTVRIMKTR